MMKTFLAASAIALLTTPAVASTTLPTTVSSFGNVIGNLAVLTDGVVPALGGPYRSDQTVVFGSSEVNGQSADFSFDFGGAVNLTTIFLSADNNDTYRILFADNGGYFGYLDILASEGSVSSGMDSFTRALSPGRAATRVIIQGVGGDYRYSLGEVRFTGSTVTAAVPEPATWAMMIGGFGLIGGAIRRRSTASVFA